ncbi:MAG: DNA-directed RNA polymerase subunit omega [Clostridia bacterium]|nr:DNA-directed RNA polymerase subunit omega [Clostridia bacterium]MBQ9506689.1 DNA-directed RNA polymerase subunit omega [Clostridia bacterium]MBR5423733.1 DNA-directed RNA polymerase subunit omega [Clostridia bacterium]
MINIDLKPMLKGGISRYSLCVAVAKRSREINDEAVERKEREKVLLEEKPVSLAVDDILSGRYVIQESEDIKNY